MAAFFSILLLGWALLCFVCSPFVNDSQVAQAISFSGPLIAPTLVVWAVMRTITRPISRRRLGLTLWMGAGAFAGAVFAEGSLMGGPPIDSWPLYYELVLLPLSITPAIGAFLFAVVGLVNEALEPYEPAIEPPLTTPVAAPASPPASSAQTTPAAVLHRGTQ